MQCALQIDGALPPAGLFRLGARLKQLGGRRRSSSGSGRSYAQVGERGHGRNANVARMGAAGSGAAGRPASKWANEPLADKI